MMRLCVCIKGGWRTDVPLRLQPGGAGLREDGRHPEISPAEWAALDLALHLRELLQAQGRPGQVPADEQVLVLSVAPAQREPLLREALACGAGSALRVWCKAWPEDLLNRMEGAADLTAALAAAAAQAIQEWSADGPLLVVTGEASADAGHGCFGAYLAAGLRVALARRVTSLQPHSGGWLAQVKLERGYSQELPLPSRAVLTVAARLTPPRESSLPAWLGSRTASIPQRLLDFPLPTAATTHLRAPVPRVKRFPVPAAHLSAEQRIEALVNLPQAGGGTILPEATGASQQVDALLSLLREHGVLRRADPDQAPRLPPGDP